MAPPIKDPLDLKAERRRKRMRLWRQGVRIAKPKLPVEVRVLQRLNREPGELVRPELGPCWPWLGARNADGYGVIRDGDRLVYVHRVALATALDRAIAEGMHACHRCDNRICARPAHLYEGTPEENTGDIIARRIREANERGLWADFAAEARA